MVCFAYHSADVISLHTRKEIYMVHLPNVARMLYMLKERGIYQKVIPSLFEITYKQKISQNVKLPLFMHNYSLY